MKRLPVDSSTAVDRYSEKINNIVEIPQKMLYNHTSGKFMFFNAMSD